jgi:hypothetical protein
MAKNIISQRSIVAMKRVFDVFVNRQLDYAEILYEHDFPDWFVSQASQRHEWNWPGLLLDLRNGNFFFAPQFGGALDLSILPGQPLLTESGAKEYGEYFIQKLAAFATTLPGSEELTRSFNWTDSMLIKRTGNLCPWGLREVLVLRAFTIGGSIRRMSIHLSPSYEPKDF